MPRKNEKGKVVVISSLVHRSGIDEVGQGLKYPVKKRRDLLFLTVT